MVFRVGLTGGIAVGKSTVADLFLSCGAEVIDADVIARELSRPGTITYQLIRESFGESFFHDNGELNRLALRRWVFTQPEARYQLEQILHPAIYDELQLQSSDVKSPYCILSVPLLIEAKMQSLVNRILVVDTDNSIQIARLQQRDALNVTEAQQHLAAQASRQQRLQYADDIIDNSQGFNNLKLQVTHLHALYCQLAATAEE